jgi:hypothetical protein
MMAQDPTSRDSDSKCPTNDSVLVSDPPCPKQQKKRSNAEEPSAAANKRSKNGQKKPTKYKLPYELYKASVYDALKETHKGSKKSMTEIKALLPKDLNKQWKSLKSTEQQPFIDGHIRVCTFMFYVTLLL